MATSFFNGESTFPENNTTDQLIDALKAQLAQTSTDSQTAISAGIAAAASASNASISEENVAGLAQQATDSLVTATAALSQATAIIGAEASATTSAATATAALAAITTTVAPFLTPQPQYTFTATAAQTEWTLPGGATYIPGSAKVFVNGVRWNRTESYGDSTGTKITFVNPLQAGWSVAVEPSLSALVPVTGISSADTVGFLGANGATTTVSALASTASNSGADLVGFKQSDAGAIPQTVQKKVARRIDVEEFGVVPGLTVSDAQAAANAVAFQAALDAMSTRGGGVVHALSQYYVLSARIYLPNSVTLCGAGVDEWEPVYSSRVKQWNGTNLVFKGASVRDIQMTGITSMKNAGGWRADPDTPANYYKLTSFYNGTAVGTTAATPRLLSAAVMNKTNARYCGLKNIRVVPWIGTDGVSDYSSAAVNTLAADWDIGVLLLNCEYGLLENVQAVGYWKEYGHLEAATAITESHSERNRRVRCKFQGRIGVGVRGMDRWAVSATTASTVAITFSEEHYWGSSGSFNGSNGTSYSYTGTSFAGSTLTFTGVTPDPTGIFEVRHAGSGFGNSEFHDVYAYSLYHTSGALASTFGLADSKPLEVSGYPLRGVKFRNFKAHTNGEKVMSFLHDAQDAIFIDPQFEGGTFIIASPESTTAVWATAPCGETRNLIMVADVGMDVMDRRLFAPRSGFVQGLMLAPRSDLTGNTVLGSLRTDKDLIIQLQSGRKLLVQTSTGTQHTFFDSGNISPKGNVFPSVGSTYSLGGSSAANWWNNVYAVAYYSNGTKVLGSQITGYGTPTGASRTASFNGASATLAQTSAQLAQIITDLKAHGLLGA